MTINNRQKAILHIAKGKLNLSDNAYRSALVHIAGVTSSTELDKAGFEALMGFFEWMGFTPLTSKGKDYGTRPGMASFAQLELIRDLWTEWSGSKVDDGLNTWLRNTFKLDSLRFVKAAQAGKIITALKAMKATKRAKAA